MIGHLATRRDVLKTAAASATGVVLGRAPAVAAETRPKLKIDAPFHGAVLSHRHGQVVEGGLRIRVCGTAPAGSRVTVNSVPAAHDGGRFTADVVLRDRETTIVATSASARDGGTDHVRVVWDRHSFPRYRFSVDDNSFFLRDIARQRYASLLDSWYLKIFRDLHVRYGAKFVLNIYYRTDDGFDLRQFPDQYKSQWQDNADWLRLAFHAHANEPARPYQNATPKKLIADLDQVAQQIVRFAGEETYSPPTVVHWAMVQPTAFKPLYERGVRVLSGYFRPDNGGWDINYLLDAERSEYLSRHDALMDFASGIVFSKVDIVCNTTPVDETVATLAPLAEEPNTAEIMDLFTHEQYFWPFYQHYLADHAKRLDVAIRWVTEHGYKPVFFHEGFLGGPA